LCTPFATNNFRAAVRNLSRFSALSSRTIFAFLIYND
jgi:hypothetical protein